MTTATQGAAWRDLRRHAPLVLACAAGFGLGLSGTPFYTLGVFVDPLQAAFGWSTAAIQGGLTVSYLTTVVCLPVIAGLCDRFGVRPVAMASVVLMGLAYGSLGTLSGWLPGYYGRWFLISLFGTGTLAITWTRAIAAVFAEGRGLALGLALVGSGITGMVGPAAARALIDAVGWRGAFVALGFLPLVLALPLAGLFFRTPDGGGLASAAARPTTARAPAPFSRRLLLLCAAFLCIAVAVTGVIPNLVKLFTVGGLSRSEAVGAAGVLGACVVVGRVGCGILVDRFWAPAVAALVLAGPAVACVLLSQPSISPATATVCAVLLGLAAGAEFDLLPFLVGRYFPLHAFTGHLAVVSAVFYLGAAAGGPLIAAIFDATGRFALPMQLAALLFALGGTGLLALGPYPAGESASFASPSVSPAPRSSGRGWRWTARR